jgi:CysZ protein
MALFPNFKLGLTTYREAHRLIVQHKLWWYVVMPAFLNLLIIAIFVIAGWYGINSFTGWLLDITGLSGKSDGFFKYLSLGLGFVIKIISYFLLFIIYNNIYKYAILLILSPALAILSEKTDKILTGNQYPFKFGRFVLDVWRGIRIALRNIFLEFLFTIVLFIIGFIPVLGWICPVIMFFITCYYYGFSMIDYSNERGKLNIRQSIKFVRKNRGMAVSNGMMFYFMFFIIPVIGFIIAPAYSVMAATIAVSKTESQYLLK